MEQERARGEAGRGRRSRTRKHSPEERERGGIVEYLMLPKGLLERLDSWSREELGQLIRKHPGASHRYEDDSH